MTNTEHAASGTMVATCFWLIGNHLPGWLFWFLYTLASLFSHFLLDAIPHGHCFVWGKDSFQKNQKGFWLEATPSILFVMIVFPLLIRKFGVYFLYYFWGMFIANVPDALAVKFNLCKRLNDWCHWFEKRKPLRKGWRHYTFRYAIVLIWLYFFLS